MSVNKVDKTTGELTLVAGKNVSTMVPSVALYQTGSFTAPSLSAGGYTTSGVISFQTPFPDTDYIITFDFENSSLIAGAIYKSASSFRAVIGNVDPNGGTGASTCYWKAYKLMTDTVHEDDAAHIAQNTANFAPAFNTTTSYAVGNYVTYNNILYRCTTAHTAGAWVAGHFTQVTVGGSIARYNDELSLPGYYSNDVLIAIKATADAVGNYKMFQGDTQAGAEAAWFGLKKTSDYWHCTVWDGHGLVAHLVYKNGTYTANVIHEGVPN